uniref:Uncharacterized protein n=1 Tax=Eutreptiella gymnastica TaxID=73025 RepID=A0A7S1I517_9EUGL|mmetsp:Transcript_130975/g.226686  ORF Transcript_130975/g.226686 Transcript_130975/m.226686 type:complete len:105 (+) Transcript_130975:1114-1428(+)
MHTYTNTHTQPTDLCTGKWSCLAKEQQLNLTNFRQHMDNCSPDHEHNGSYMHTHHTAQELLPTPRRVLSGGTNISGRCRQPFHQVLAPSMGTTSNNLVAIKHLL